MTMKKNYFLIIYIFIFLGTNSIAQQNYSATEGEIIELIDMYAKARETKDTVLLQVILTEDVDQLVSSGEWRRGLQDAIDGMQRSTDTNPGSRTLNVKEVKFLTSEVAIADAEYLIRSGGEERKMWSSFVIVNKNNTWKIASIRNMLPAK